MQWHLRSGLPGGLQDSDSSTTSWKRVGNSLHWAARTFRRRSVSIGSCSATSAARRPREPSRGLCDAGNASRTGQPSSVAAAGPNCRLPRSPARSDAAWPLMSHRSSSAFASADGGASLAGFSCCEERKGKERKGRCSAVRHIPACVSSAAVFGGLTKVNEGRQLAKSNSTLTAAAASQPRVRLWMAVSGMRELPWAPPCRACPRICTAPALPPAPSTHKIGARTKVGHGA